jgi:hypothetical protein
MFTLLVKQMDARMLLALLLLSMGFVSIHNMPVNVTVFSMTTDFARD